MTSVFPRVVLHIGRNSSRCGACGKGADPAEVRHRTVLSYAPGDPRSGCGAVFTHVSSDYVGEDAALATRHTRPDLEYIA